MITTGFSYLASIVFLAAIIVWVQEKYEGKFFDYVPAIVLLYFLTMVIASFNLWGSTDAINNSYDIIKTNMLPAMIFLMLLKADLRKIIKLGPKMILGFFVASISIGIGFIVVYGLLNNFFPSDAWKSFGALAGSWMGGTGNMVAVQGALEVPDSKMGYALLMDSVNYSIWVMILLSLVSFSDKFNKWTGASTKVLDEVGKKLDKEQSKIGKEVEFADMIILLGSGFLVSTVAQYFANFLPQTSFLTHTTWTVIIASIAGVLCAMTSLGKRPGSNQISRLMLYILVGLIASRADLSSLTQAPKYILTGFLILGIHALLLFLSAKIFKLNLFTCGIASLSNIGGVASAPILAAAYNEVLIPIGVLMAMLGYIVGTGGGLVISKIMSLL